MALMHPPRRLLPLAGVWICHIGACSAQTTAPIPPPPPSACLIPSGALGGGDDTLRVSPQVRHQTLDGFGTTVRLFDDPHLSETSVPETGRGAVVVPPADQAAILSALYADLHLNRIRYATDPGVEVVNDNADPGITDLSKFNFAWKRLDAHADYVKAARPLGVTTWFGAPIGLESWMSHDNPAEYVEWAMAIIRRWRDLGVTMPYWSLANEPGYGANLSGAFLRDAAKALGARLAAEGIPTRLVVPDDNNPPNALGRARTILADPEARRYVAAVAVHLYDAAFPPAHPDTASLGELAALAHQNGLPLWMTEWFNPDWFTWARTVHAMLADYDMTAVDYLWGFLGQWEKVGAQLITITSVGDTYTGWVKNKQYWTTGQWSRFVLPGSVRIDAISGDASIKATAWLVEDHLVIVALNVGGGDRSVQFALGPGAPCVRTMTAERTGLVETARILDPVTLTGPGFTTTLPATTVTTFVLRP